MSIGTIDPVAFYIGSWPVYWYGLILGMAGLLGYWIFIRESDRKGFDTDLMFDFFFWAVIFALIGARLYYVAFEWDYYQDNLHEIPQVWQGGLAIYGGIIGAVLSIAYMSRRHNQSLLTILDMAAPGLMLGQSVGRWGNFMNQEAHGGPVSRTFLESLHLPNWLITQMNIEGIYYHPTFLYESLWNLLGFVIIIILRRQQEMLRQGHIVCFYLIWYGAGRMVIEGMRTDSLYLGNYRVSQWLSLILILVGTWLAFRQVRWQAPFYEKVKNQGVD